LPLNMVTWKFMKMNREIHVDEQACVI